MELLSVIRRWHCRDHLPIREIERRTGLSRNTIRKYLRAQSIEPRFQVPERPSRLDPFADRLRGWLVLEAARSRKNRRTYRPDEPASGPQADLARENERLRLENRILREEREILKKATQFFASQKP